MKGRVEADAKYFRLPYDVLIGRDSEILREYHIIKLPHIIIVGKNGSIHFADTYASYEKLKEEISRALR